MSCAQEASERHEKKSGIESVYLYTQVLTGRSGLSPILLAFLTNCQAVRVRGRIPAESIPKFTGIHTVGMGVLRECIIEVASGINPL